MRGIVRDRSGKPIVGAIIVLNGGVRIFTADGGYFHALLAPGNHNIEAVAEGYQKQYQEVLKSILSQELAFRKIYSKFIMLIYFFSNAYKI